MVFRCLLTVFVLIAHYSNPALAQVEEDRPRVGLALSGGGARGGAHVGVLQALEELQVPIDYIAGTSMGAIVGGLYAAGYTADEIGKVLNETDWTRALSDEPERKDRTMRTKEVESDFLIPYRIGYNSGRVQLPLGAVEGQHLDQILNALLLPVADIKNFDDLPIPFRAVATDLETGDELVLAGGSLPNAMRASMSVPGVFAPVRIDGRLLVDGGMVNNLPVSIVRAMGADVVIAVDISTPLLTAEQLVSVLSVTEQLTGFLTRRNTEQQIQSLGPRDFLIVPPLGDFSAADFEGAGKLVQIGAESTLEHRDRLAALAGVSTAQPAREGWRKYATGPEYVVSYIELQNDSVIDDRIILSRLNLQVGQPLDLAALDRGVDAVYALDVFRSVTYDFLESSPGAVGVKIIASPREWGPNYMQFGLELANDFVGSNSFLLGAAYTRNALNSLGGELRVVGSIGREDKLSFDVYQPIDLQARWFVEPELFYRQRNYDLWLEDTRIAEFQISSWSTKLAIGKNLSLTDQLRLGYEFGRGDAELLIGFPIFPLDQRIKIGELVPEYRHDSFDSPWFPTSGMLHRLRYRYADNGLGAGSDYRQVTTQGGFAWSHGKNTMLLDYEANYSFDDAAPLERWFSLGGFGRLSGLAPNQLTGRHSALLTLALYRRLNEVKMLPAYAGFTLETGNTWYLADEIGFDKLHYSASLFIGAESPLGPLYLAVGYSDYGDAAAYFYIGNPFSTASFE